MNVICLIPARVGSKGIPDKNFKPLAGISPIDRAVTCCLGAGYTPYVSSNGENTRGWPFWVQRGEELARDETPMSAVVLDFLDRIEGSPDEIVLLVQPTQPLRQPMHLHHAVELLSRYESVASVCGCDPVEKSYRVVNGFLLPAFPVSVERRQDAPLSYRCDGTVYAFRRQTFLNCPDFRTPRTAALIIPPEESAPLDTPLDWLNAENRLIFQGIHTRPPFCPTPP